MRIDAQEALSMPALRESAWEVKVVKNEDQLFQSNLISRLVDCAKGVYPEGDSFVSQTLIGVVRAGGTVQYVTDRFNKVLGFAASGPMPRGHAEDPDRPRADVYFPLSTVRKSHRSRGVFNAVNRACIEDATCARAQSFQLDTQNPRVEVSTTHVLDAMVAEGSIAGYSMTRTRHRTPGIDYRDIVEPSQWSNDSAVNAEYQKLDLQHGEQYILTFSIRY